MGSTNKIEGEIMQVTKVIEHITDWLNSYVEKSGVRGFVIGYPEASIPQ